MAELDVKNLFEYLAGSLPHARVFKTLQVPDNVAPFHMEMLAQAYVENVHMREAMVGPQMAQSLWAFLGTLPSEVQYQAARANYLVQKVIAQLVEENVPTAAGASGGIFTANQAPEPSRQSPHRAEESSKDQAGNLDNFSVMKGALERAVEVLEAHPEFQPELSDLIDEILVRIQAFIPDSPLDPGTFELPAEVASVIHVEGDANIHFHFQNGGSSAPAEESGTPGKEVKKPLLSEISTAINTIVGAVGIAVMIFSASPAGGDGGVIPSEMCGGYTQSEGQAVFDREYYRVITQGGNLMVRSTPDTSDNNNIISRLKPGTRVRLTGVGAGNFVEVQFGGEGASLEEGCVDGTFLTPVYR